MDQRKEKEEATNQYLERTKEVLEIGFKLGKYQELLKILK